MPENNNYSDLPGIIPIKDRVNNINTKPDTNEPYFDPSIGGFTSGSSASDILRTPLYSVPLNQTDYSRFTGAKGFNEHGYSLIRNNEAFYDAKQSSGEWWKNSLSRMGTRAYQVFKEGFNFADDYKSITSIMEDESRLDLEKLETELQQDYPLFKSPYEKAGLTGFFSTGAHGKWGALIDQAGFTVGTMGAAIVQSAILTAVTEGVGIGAAPIRIGKALQAMAKYSKYLNDANKVKKSLGILTATRNITQGIRQGNMFQTLGGGYIQFRMASGEGIIEAGETALSTKNKLIEDYKRNNFGAEPEGNELERIEEASMDAAQSTYWFNLPVLLASNTLQTFNIFNTYKGLSQVTKRAAKNIVRDKVAGGVMRTANLTGSARRLNQLANIGKFTLKNAVSEGAEEFAQKVVSEAAGDYFSKKYNKEAFSFADSVGVGFKAASSPEGMEEFWAGFLTGGIIGIGNAAVTKIYSGKKQAEKEEQIVSDINTSFNEVAKLLVVTGKTGESTSEQYINADQMQTAVEENDKKTFNDLKHETLVRAVSNVKRYGKLDLFKESLRHLSNLGEDEFKNLTGRDFKTTSKEKVSEIVNNKIEAIDNIAREFERLDDLFGESIAIKDGINVSKLNEKELTELALREKAFEYYKEYLVLNETKVTDIDNRIFDLHSQFEKETGVNFQDAYDLTKGVARKQKIKLVEDEISEIGQTLDMISSTDKESKKDKQELEKKLKDKVKELKILESYENKFKIAENKAKKTEDPKGTIHKFIADELKAYLEHISETKNDYRKLGTSTSLLVDYLELENDRDEAILALNYLDNPTLTGVAADNAGIKLMRKLAEDNFNKAKKDVTNTEEKDKEEEEEETTDDKKAEIERLKGTKNEEEVNLNEKQQALVDLIKDKHNQPKDTIVEIIFDEGNGSIQVPLEILFYDKNVIRFTQTIDYINSLDISNVDDHKILSKEQVSGDEIVPLSAPVEVFNYDKIENEMLAQTHFRTESSEENQDGNKKYTGQKNDSEIQRRKKAKNNLPKQAGKVIITLNSTQYPQVDEYQKQIEEGKLKKDIPIVAIVANMNGNPLHFDEKGNFITKKEAERKVKESEQTSTPTQSTEAKKVKIEDFYLVENLSDTSKDNRRHRAINSSKVLTKAQKKEKLKLEKAAIQIAKDLREGKAKQFIASIQEVSPGELRLDESNLVNTSSLRDSVKKVFIKRDGPKNTKGTAKFLMDTGVKLPIVMNKVSDELKEVLKYVILNPKSLKEDPSLLRYVQLTSYFPKGSKYYFAKYKLSGDVFLMNQETGAILNPKDKNDIEEINTFIDGLDVQLNVDKDSDINKSIISTYIIKDNKPEKTGTYKYKDFLIDNSQTFSNYEQERNNIFIVIGNLETPVSNEEVTEEDIDTPSIEDEAEFFSEKVTLAPATKRSFAFRMMPGFAKRNILRKEGKISYSEENINYETMLDKAEGREFRLVEDLDNLVRYRIKGSGFQVFENNKWRDIDSRSAEETGVIYSSGERGFVWLSNDNNASTDTTSDLQKEVINKSFKNIPPILKKYRFLKDTVNSKAWGRWTKSVTTLHGDSTVNTANHEAWHDFSQFMLTPQEKIDLYEELIKVTPELRDNKATTLQKYTKAEEYLAEDYVKYINSNNVLKGRPVRNVIFRALYKLVDALLSYIGLDLNLSNKNNLKIVLDNLYNNLKEGNLDINDYSFSNPLDFKSLNSSTKISTKLNQMNVSKNNPQEALRNIDDMFNLKLSEVIIDLTKSQNRVFSLDSLKDLNNTQVYSELYTTALNSLKKSLILHKTQYTKEEDASKKNQIADRIEFLEFLISDYKEVVKDYSNRQRKGPIDDDLIINVNSENGHVSFVEMIKGVPVVIEDEKRTSKAIEWTLNGNESSIKDASSDITRFLMRGIHELQKQDNGRYNVFYNKYGLLQTVNPDKIWNNIGNKLSNIADIDAFYDGMIELSEIVPEVLFLLRQVPNLSSDKIEAANKKIRKLLQNNQQSFFEIQPVELYGDDKANAVSIYRTLFKDFDRYKIKQRIVILNRDSQGKVIARLINASSVNINNLKQKIDSNLNKFILNEDYVNDSKTDRVLDYYKDRVLDLDKYNKLVNTYLKSNDKVLLKDIFKIIGLELTDEIIGSKEFKKLKIDDLLNYFIEVDEYNKGTEGITDNNNKLLTVEIISPIDALNKKGFSYKANNKYYNVYSKNGYLNELLTAYIDNTPDIVSNSVKNADNDTQHELSYNTFTTKFIQALNDHVKYPNLNSLISDPEFAFFNPETNMPLRNSAIFGSIFNIETGERIVQDNFEPIIVNGKEVINYNTIDIFNLSGVNISSNLLEEKNTGLTSQTSIKMSSEDKLLLMDIPILFGSKVKENLRTSDKSSHFALRYYLKHDDKKGDSFFLTEFEDSIEDYLKVGKPLHNILVKYLKYELERIKSDKPNIKDYNERANDFIIMADILGVSYDEFVEKIGDTYEGNEKVINKVISEKGKIFFTEKSKELITNTFKNTQLTPKFINGMELHPDLASKTPKDIFDFYYMETFVRNVEESLFLYGDMAAYKDFFKRSPAFSSTGPTARVDKYLLEGINEDPYYRAVAKRDLTDKQIEDLEEFDGNLSFAVAEDLKVEIGEDVVKEIAKHISNKEKKEAYLDAYLGDLKDRSDLTDAQALTTFDSYRMISKSLEQWSPKQEAVYKKIADNLPIALNEVAFFPPLKLGFTGPIKNSKGDIIVSYHKYSVAPLIPGAYPADSALNEIMKQMHIQGIDYLTFDSAAKFGNFKTGNKLYDENGNVNNKFEKASLYMSYIKNQLNIEAKQKGVTIFGSQFRKLLFNDVFSKGVPTDFLKKTSAKDPVKYWNSLSEEQKEAKSELYELYNMYNKSIKDLVDAKKEELLEKGIKISGDNVEITDFNLFREEVLFRANLKGLDDDAIEFLSDDIDENGFRTFLESSKNRYFVDSIIASLVNNDLIRQKVNGEPMVQVSEVGHSKIVDKKHRYFLDSYRIDGDKMRAVEVGLTFNITHHAPLLNLVYDGNKLLVKDNIEQSILNLNQAMGDEKWRKENERFFKMVGYRIPTQSLQSIDIITIKYFLSPLLGNQIVVPGNIVTKTGSDFDIDKMQLFKPEYGYEKTEVEVKTTLKKTAESNYDNPFANQFMEKGMLDEELSALENISTPTILDSSMNQIIEITFELLSRLDMVEKMHAPLVNYNLNSLFDKLGVTKPDIKNNVFDKNFEMRSRDNVVEGSKELGIAATISTMNQLIKLDDVVVSLYYKDSKGREIKPTTLLKVNRNENKMVTLSDLNTVNGVSKADIFSEFISAFVDIANNSDISLLGFNYHSTPVANYLTLQGAALEDTVSLLLQPLVQKYSKAMTGKLSDTLSGKARREKQLDILTELIESVDDNIIKKVALQRLSNMKFEHEQSGEIRIKGKNQMTYEINSLVRLFENKFKSESNKLKETSTLNSEDPAVQVLALIQYVELKNQADKFRDFQKLLNHDTTTVISTAEGILLDKVKKSILESDNGLIVTKSYEKIYENSPIRQLDTRPLLAPMFLKVHKFLGLPFIVENMAQLMLKENINSSDYSSFARNILNDTLLFLIQNSTDRDFASSLVDARSENNIKTKHDKLLQILNKYQLKGSEKELIDNIQIKKDEDTNFIKIFFNERRLDNDTTNRLKEGWINFISDNLILIPKNNEQQVSDKQYIEDLGAVKEFFEDLAKAKIYSYGTGLAANSFWNLIPNNLFENIITPKISRLLNDPNRLQKFIKVYNTSFNNLFMTNNKGLFPFSKMSNLKIAGYFKNYHRIEQEGNGSIPKNWDTITKVVTKIVTETSTPETEPIIQKIDDRISYRYPSTINGLNTSKLIELSNLPNGKEIRVTNAVQYENISKKYGENIADFLEETGETLSKEQAEFMKNNPIFVNEMFNTFVDDYYNGNNVEAIDIKEVATKMLNENKTIIDKNQLDLFEDPFENGCGQ